jgi:hypothetical protein
MAASPLTRTGSAGAQRLDHAAGTAAPGSAQLLIHAASDPPVGDGVLERLLLVLRGLLADGRLQRRPALATDLRIADLQGRPCFAADNALALITVYLPAGTYHVSARLGAVQRRYTLTLERGATVDLHLRLNEHRH